MPFVIVALVGFVLALAAMFGRQQRRQACIKWAAQHGFEFADRNAYGLDELGFAFFQRGHSHRWRNVMVGVADGHRLVLADFQYTEGSGKHSSTFDQSVAVIDVAAILPWVEIQREGFVSALAGAVGFDDVQFESREFNDRFLVKTTEAEFAYKLIDARMMEWLMTTAPPIFETWGRFVLVAFDRIDPADFEAMITHARGFVAHIPRLVLADYAIAKRPR